MSVVTANEIDQLMERVVGLAQLAVQLTRRAWAGQQDKGRLPYIAHPARVTARSPGPTSWRRSPGCMTSRWPTSPRLGFSTEVTELWTPTERPGEETDTYYDHVVTNGLAVKVKRAEH